LTISLTQAWNDPAYFSPCFK